MGTSGRKVVPITSFIALIAATVVAVPALAETMSGAQISAQIVGKDLATRRMGMTVHLRYDADGTVAVKTPLFSGSGHWKLVGASLCMTLTEGPRQGETCHTFEDMGGGAYRNSEGQILRGN